MKKIFLLFFSAAVLSSCAKTFSLDNGMVNHLNEGKEIRFSAFQELVSTKSGPAARPMPAGSVFYIIGQSFGSTFSKLYQNDLAMVLEGGGCEIGGKQFWDADKGYQFLAHSRFDQMSHFFTDYNSHNWDYWIDYGKKSLGADELYYHVASSFVPDNDFLSTSLFNSIFSSIGSIITGTPVSSFNQLLLQYAKFNLFGSNQAAMWAEDFVRGPITFHVTDVGDARLYDFTRDLLVSNAAVITSDDIISEEFDGIVPLYFNHATSKIIVKVSSEVSGTAAIDLCNVNMAGCLVTMDPYSLRAGLESHDIPQEKEDIVNSAISTWEDNGKPFAGVWLCPTLDQEGDLLQRFYEYFCGYYGYDPNDQETKNEFIEQAFHLCSDMERTPFAAPTSPDHAAEFTFYAMPQDFGRNYIFPDDGLYPQLYVKFLGTDEYEYEYDAEIDLRSYAIKWKPGYSYTYNITLAGTKSGDGSQPGILNVECVTAPF